MAIGIIICNLSISLVISGNGIISVLQMFAHMQYDYAIIDY